MTDPFPVDVHVSCAPLGIDFRVRLTPDPVTATYQAVSPDCEGLAAEGDSVGECVDMAIDTYRVLKEDHLPRKKR